jgi:hypothetical protein
MTTKQLQVFAILLILFLSGPVFAQIAAQQPAAGNALHQARVLLKFGREDIVKEEMRFSESESAAFWPVYDKYQADMIPVRDRYADLLSSYLTAYREGTVSKQMAIQLTDDYLDIQSDVLKIKRKHLKDFRRALPPRKAARFYQLENKMDLELESQLAAIVPLIDPV